MSEHEAPPRLSPTKRLAGFVALAMVLLVTGGLGFWLSGATRTTTSVAPAPVAAIVLGGLGVVMAVMGMALYGVALATNGFRFNFANPFFSTFGGKLWVLNLLVGLLLQAGFGFMMAPSLLGIAGRFLPPTLAFPIAFFVPFILATFVLVWFQIWAPLEQSVIVKRLLARGIPPTLLDRGIPAGISDPAKSSFKKMTLVEEDIGMLWIEPDVLSYRGDTIDFDIRRDQLLEIEQRADAGSTSSYFGAAQIILRFMQDDGGERRVRLHPEANWTMTAKARMLNDLARRLKLWKAAPAQGPTEG